MAGFSGAGGPEWLTWVNIYLGQGQPLFLALYSALIIFFAFFYTGTVFNPDETAANLKINGGLLPAIRTGPSTADHLRPIIFRLGAVGQPYLTLVSVLPEILPTESKVTLYFRGNSVLNLVTLT